ncbi:NAD(P)/FAD-dependent oxidoreductase [Hirschia maritima]|uniref:FAD/NAD(P)-binding protein n=1 Tax=Hirschia maritima TaxID=1121961 RepID=UPI000362EF75|nr:FAD/NAD(P)-binding protein [Hirschia maritima]
MSRNHLETDYLIVGAGAVGMAFTDVILKETDANIILVDQHHKPGGHWNDAYPFVTLHQPSAYYGVSSVELSRGQKDLTGWNKGLGDLASGAEVSAYFDNVMKQHFLPSGRVQFHSMCRYDGDKKFTNILSGEEFDVSVRRKTIDATFLKTTVPSTHTPNFSISPDVQFMPLNNLPKVRKTPAGYVVIGAGKTGIDACLWLLEQGASPDSIQWIMPRDAWLLDRKNTQATEEFFFDAIGSQAGHLEAIATSESIHDMFDKLEACGWFLRIDENVRPSMFHGATVSQMELEQLRRIKNIIRLGRVQSIEHDKIILDQGEIPTSPDHLHIDCSARAISNEEIKPIFQGDLITPQMVRSYQPVFSAAFIAHTEAAYGTDEEKNNFCGVVPLPNHDTDFIKFTAAFLMNQYKWGQTPEIRKWLFENRLDGFSKLLASVKPEDTEKSALLDKLRANAPLAATKLFQFMNEIN